MNEIDRERVKDLLSRAAQLPPEARRTFIEQSNEDSHISAEALELLSMMDDSAFLSAVTGAGMAAAIDQTAPILEEAGSRIGRYKLLQRIGEGGFGTVFMAEQIEPVVRRVALKIIKAGMDTRQVIARFEAERQALAVMDHPNIAHVFDAGATDSGRPYFVMELVRGAPVTHYCDQQQLSIEERLALFQDICGAVQHAHQKGIIHRDIKPSNVLITVADGRPLPKIIDFGIAKATTMRLTDKTLFTELHQLIGTPEYMSPEQAEIAGVDVDTRSDIYSLGVLLYELLAGSPPFDSRRLRTVPFAEIQRIIRDEEPPRPSLRFRTLAASSNVVLLPTLSGSKKPSTDDSAVEIAAKRRTQPLALTRSLKGDLDWIVMKCLEKDRSRRYETAGALAGDLAAYQAHRPVSAMPPSPTYRLRKLIQRNRVAVLAATAIAATLIAATGVSIAFAMKASRALAAEETQRRLAEQRAEETEQVAQFQQTQLSDIDPELMGKRLHDDFLAEAKAGMQRSGLSASQITDRQKQLTVLLADANPTNVALKSLEENIFERALKTANQQFKDQPVVKAHLLQALADTLMDLGMSDQAMDAQTQALAIRRQELGNDDPLTVTSINNMAQLLLNCGKFSEAESYCREALKTMSKIEGNDSRHTLLSTNNLGLALMMEGKRDEGELLFRDLLDRYRRVFGPDDPGTLQILNNIAGLLVDNDKFSAAEPLFREALQKRQHALGEDHPDTILSLNNLALVIEKQGRPTDAEPLYREALERSRRVRGEDHPDTLLYMSNLGFLLYTMNELPAAEPLTREALERRRHVLGEDHVDTLQSLNNLGMLLQAQGKLTEAEPILREAFDKRQRLLGDNHLLTLQSMSNLGILLRSQGKLSEAEPFYRKALEKRRQILGGDHLDTLESMNNMGQLLLAQGKPSEAEPLFNEAAAAYEKRPPGNDLGRLEAQLGLARSLLTQARTDQAEQILTTIDSELRTTGMSARIRQKFLKALVDLYESQDRVTPHKGYDRKAADYRATLESTNPKR